MTAPVLHPLPPALSPRALYATFIDWSSDTPAQFNARLGTRTACFHYFCALTTAGVDADDAVVAAAQQSRDAGAAFLLTVEPWTTSLDAVDGAMLDSLLALLRRLVRQLNVCVLLRFAHEMNGSWYPWGRKPLQYVRCFRRVATAVKQAMPQVVLVWSVNGGVGYPFSAPIRLTANSTDDARAMDTNGDGWIDHKDDPYTPYWPGEEYVDWIGVDIYHFGDMDNACNAVAGKKQFATLMTGSPFRLYDMFAKRYNKPFAITETGASYYPEDKTSRVSELDVKRSWWTQLTDTRIKATYPLLAMVCWFEIAKREDSGAHKNVLRDFRLTHDPAMARQFCSAQPPWMVFDLAAALSGQHGDATNDNKKSAPQEKRKSGGFLRVLGLKK
ncbi:hypothetical protein RI367_007504 [Sorochytrium milnesiophthora]